MNIKSKTTLLSFLSLLLLPTFESKAALTEVDYGEKYGGSPKSVRVNFSKNEFSSEAASEKEYVAKNNNFAQLKGLMYATKVCGFSGFKAEAYSIQYSTRRDSSSHFVNLVETLFDIPEGIDNPFYIIQNREKKIVKNAEIEGDSNTVVTLEGIHDEAQLEFIHSTLENSKMRASNPINLDNVSIAINSSVLTSENKEKNISFINSLLKWSPKFLELGVKKPLIVK